MRENFPIFEHYPGLVYLDSAATTQKPRVVIEAERYFYEWQNANVHRGIYPLADKATAAYENTREKARAFLNAREAGEIIFTSGATAGINLVAQSYAAGSLQEGDVVIISAMEHHSNLIPWQQVCLQKKARLLVIPVTPDGALDLSALPAMLRENRVKLLAVTHISNTLGTINPIAGIIALAHQYSVPVLVDAAQSAASHRPDVQALDADFLVFSAHKMFGPTGVGVLYGKKALLEQMPPWQFGGEMIRDVTFDCTVFAGLPHKFEAGTPNIAGVAAFGAALDFIISLDREAITGHNKALLEYATGEMSRIPGLEIIGRAKEKSGILSFVLHAAHPHDIATILGEQQICIRAGHHCTQPLMDALELPATARASFSIYNTEEDIVRLVAGIKQVQRLMGA
ncbi:MAG: cysteine desulfurase [Thermoanaerobaculia bacterium]|nr:cysteine desulfurase [Thermoanaerobaculia bacterium]